MNDDVNEFTPYLEKAREFATTLGLTIHDSAKLDPYFKGDMDGENIWISFKLDDEEELFNVLHMIGHCIQWGVSDDLMKLGCILHQHPDHELLRRLQVYEWEANCYAYTILINLGGDKYAEWLFSNYREDMMFLTHFYLTGEKVKVITPLALENAFIKPLELRTIPSFTPKHIEGTRNGIVIDFKTAEELPRIPA
jgi:hypothetical protein